MTLASAIKVLLARRVRRDRLDLRASQGPQGLSEPLDRLDLKASLDRRGLLEPLDRLDPLGLPDRRVPRVLLAWRGPR